MEDLSDEKRNRDIKKLMKEVREYEDVPISVDSSEIYEIKNKETGLSYFGHAQSYEKHGKNKPLSKFGAKGRFERHMNNAFCDKKSQNYSECPVFYPAIREHGRKAWRSVRHLVVPTEDAKKWETKFIEAHQSYKSEYGYNMLTGTFKPKTGINKKKIEDRIGKSNRRRAVGGKIKRSEDTKKLPPNINIRKRHDEIVGFHVQMKIGTKLHSKAFLNTEYTIKQKLSLAKKQREEFQKLLDNPDHKLKIYSYRDLNITNADSSDSDDNSSDSNNTSGNDSGDDSD